MNDPRSEALQRQLLFANVLRDRGLDDSQDGGGYQGGKVFMVGSPVGRVLSGLAGQYMGSRVEGQMEDLNKQRNAELDQFMTSRPQTMGKTAAQVFDEQQKWLGSPNATDNPLIQTMRQQAMQKGMDWPEKMLGAESARLINQEKAAERAAMFDMTRQDRQAQEDWRRHQGQQKIDLDVDVAQNRYDQAQQAFNAKRAAADDAKRRAVELIDNGLLTTDIVLGKRDTKGNLLEKPTPPSGFTSAVGAGMPFAMDVPWPTSAKDYLALHKQLLGIARSSGIEQLKGAGQVSNAEGAAAAAAMNRIPENPRDMSEAAYLDAVTQYQNLMLKAKERLTKGIRVTPDGREYPIGSPPAGYTDPLDPGAAPVPPPRVLRRAGAAAPQATRGRVLPQATGSIDPATQSDEIERALSISEGMSAEGRTPDQILRVMKSNGISPSVIEGVLNGNIAVKQEVEQPAQPAVEQPAQPAGPPPGARIRKIDPLTGKLLP